MELHLKQYKVAQRVDITDLNNNQNVCVNTQTHIKYSVENQRTQTEFNLAATVNKQRQIQAITPLVLSTSFQ